MATGVGRGKMKLAAFDGPSPKTPLWAQKSRENLLRKPSYSPFCPKFRCHGNQGREMERGRKIGKEKGRGNGEGKREGEGQGEGEGKG